MILSMVSFSLPLSIGLVSMGALVSLKKEAVDLFVMSPVMIIILFTRYGFKSVI